jgi:hypothetical protein
MDQYFQEGGVDIPTFDFNPNSGILGISGRSFPENTVGVYLPLLEWLDTYVQNAAPETCIKFNLDYFNSSTYKAFLNILLRLEKLIDQDKKVKVEWYFNARDIDMKEAGEEFSELVDIPFTIISK